MADCAATFARCCGNGGPKVVLVENASRFARDLVVQLTGHEMMKKAGIELIPVDAPDFFTDPTPTVEMVRQILGALAQLEKANLVAKLKHARDRKRAETERCEGRKAIPAEVVAEARRLARKNPKTGYRRSLRQITTELAALGYVGPSGQPYHANSVRQMFAKGTMPTVRMVAKPTMTAALGCGPRITIRASWSSTSARTERFSSTRNTAYSS